MDHFEVQIFRLLQLAAVLQLGIAVLNLFLVRLLNWRSDLERMPLLLREVFQVHAWFITITLTLFGVLTWRFALEMAANPIGRWLCAGIGLFWGARAILQVTYYSAAHWRGNLSRTLIHVVLVILYGGFAAVYLCAAFNTLRGA